MTEPIDIFSLHEIPITLTYGYPGAEPITFHLRACLEKEDQAVRQAHVALTDEEKAKRLHAHQVEMLVRLSTRAPEGLQGINGDKDFAEPLRNLLLEETPMKVRVVADALTLYYQVTVPAEFFRSV